MHPITTSLLLGLTAAMANVFGGTIIVQRHWERRYLKYFIALGAGFMLATALLEVVPASLELRGRTGALLILAGYLIIHFFEHTFRPVIESLGATISASFVTENSENTFPALPLILRAFHNVSYFLIP